MTEKNFYADDIIAGNLQNVVETPNKETTSFVVNMDDNGTDGKMTVWAGAYQRIVKNKNIFIRENQNDGINIYRHETKWPEFIRRTVILSGVVDAKYNSTQPEPWQLGGMDLRIVICDKAKKSFYAHEFFPESPYVEIDKKSYEQAVAGLQNTNAPAQEEVVDAQVVEDDPVQQPADQNVNTDEAVAGDDKDKDAKKKSGLFDRLREKGKQIKAKRKNKKSKQSTQEIVDEEGLEVPGVEADSVEQLGDNHNPVDMDPVVVNVDQQPGDNNVQPDDNVQPLNSEQSVDQDPVVLNFQFGENDDPENPTGEQNDEVDPDAQGENDDPENPTGESENNTDKKSKGKTVAITVAAAALLAAGVWFFGGKRGGGNSNSDVTPVVPVDTIPAPVPVDTVPVVDTNNVQPVVNPNKPPKLVRRDPTIWQPGDPKPAHIKRRAIYNGR